MYEIPMETPASAHEQKKLSAFKEKFKGNAEQINTCKIMHFVEVDCFRIGKYDEILMTNGLNACTGLVIQTNDITFAAHFSHDEEIDKIAQAIRRESNETSIANASVKICLGPWENDSDSLKAALKLLRELGLLDAFIRTLQEYIIKMAEIKSLEVKHIERKDDRFSFQKIPSMFWDTVKGELTIHEFLNFHENEYHIDLYRLANFIDSIKSNFKNEINSPLQQIKHLDYVSTLDVVTLEPTSNLINKFNQ